MGICHSLSSTAGESARDEWEGSNFDTRSLKEKELTLNASLEVQSCKKGEAGESVVRIANQTTDAEAKRRALAVRHVSLYGRRRGGGSVELEHGEESQDPPLSLTRKQSEWGVGHEQASDVGSHPLNEDFDPVGEWVGDDSGK